MTLAEKVRTDLDIVGPSCFVSCCLLHQRYLRSPPVEPCHVYLQVVYGHLDEPDTQDIRRGVSYLRLRPGTGFGCCNFVPTFQLVDEAAMDIWKENT